MATELLDEADEFDSRGQRKIRHLWECPYYPAVALWLRHERGLDETRVDHRPRDFFSSDVVGWKAGSLPHGPVTCVEVKGHHHRLPIGSAGYGSIGQAIALRRLADFSYLAWPVPAPDTSEDGSSAAVVELDREDYELARRLKLTDKRSLSAEEFRSVVAATFNYFFAHTDVGLLTIERSIRLWAPSGKRMHGRYTICGYDPSAADHIENVSLYLIGSHEEYEIPNAASPGRRVSIRVHEEVPAKRSPPVDPALRAWWLGGRDADEDPDDLF